MADQRHSAEPVAEVRSSNLLVDALPEKQRKELLEVSEDRELRVGDVLYEPGRRMGTVYFPTSVVVSMCILTKEGTWLGTGITGSEGFIGLPVFLGSGITPNRMAMVLIPGRALALQADAFLHQLEASPPLAGLLRRHTQVFITQLAQAVLCEHEHRVEERVARWLLMGHDRVPEEGLPITHESLARLVGARRPSVTEAIGRLARRGAIAQSRRHIAVMDRGVLEQTACECYEVIRDELQRLMPLT